MLVRRHRISALCVATRIRAARGLLAAPLLAALLAACGAPSASVSAPPATGEPGPTTASPSTVTEAALAPTHEAYRASDHSAMTPTSPPPLEAPATAYPAPTLPGTEPLALPRVERRYEETPYADLLLALDAELLAGDAPALASRVSGEAGLEVLGLGILEGSAEVTPGALREGLAAALADGAPPRILGWLEGQGAKDGALRVAVATCCWPADTVRTASAGAGHGWQPGETLPGGLEVWVHRESASGQGWLWERSYVTAGSPASDIAIPSDLETRLAPLALHADMSRRPSGAPLTLFAPPTPQD